MNINRCMHIESSETYAGDSKPCIVEKNLPEMESTNKNKAPHIVVTRSLLTPLSTATLAIGSMISCLSLDGCYADPGTPEINKISVNDITDTLEKAIETCYDLSNQQLGILVTVVARARPVVRAFVDRGSNFAPDDVGTYMMRDGIRYDCVMINHSLGDMISGIELCFDEKRSIPGIELCPESYLKAIADTVNDLLPATTTLPTTTLPTTTLPTTTLPTTTLPTTSTTISAMTDVTSTSTFENISITTKNILSTIANISTNAPTNITSTIVPENMTTIIDPTITTSKNNGHCWYCIAMIVIGAIGILAALSFFVYVLATRSKRGKTYTPSHDQRNDAEEVVLVNITNRNSTCQSN